MKQTMMPVSIDWVEIPAGNYLVGLSNKQKRLLLGQLFQRFGWWKMLYEYRTLFQAGETAILLTKVQEQRYLDRFYISRYPITIEQYVTYQRCTGYTPSTANVKHLNDGWGRLPVMTTYQQALQFCEYYKVDIPTSDEWEKSARGIDGRLYPWGNHWDSKRGNVNKNATRSSVERPAHYTLTMEVDNFPSGQSPYGVWDLVGNIQEFTRSSATRKWPIKGDDRLAWLFNVVAMEHCWDSGDQGYLGFRVVCNKPY